MLITFTTVLYMHEADLLCMKLAASGIKTFIPDQNTMLIQPCYASALGGIRIQVDENDFARAGEVLKNDLPQASSDESRP